MVEGMSKRKERATRPCIKIVLLLHSWNTYVSITCRILLVNDLETKQPIRLLPGPSLGTSWSKCCYVNVSAGSRDTSGRHTRLIQLRTRLPTRFVISEVCCFFRAAAGMAADMLSSLSFQKISTRCTKTCRCSCCSFVWRKATTIIARSRVPYAGLWAPKTSSPHASLVSWMGYWRRSPRRSEYQRQRSMFLYCFYSTSSVRLTFSLGSSLCSNI